MTRFFLLASALATAAASLSLTLPAAAENSAAPASDAANAPDPADAKAAVPPIGYRSAFTGYRPLSDDKLGWKQANDEVGHIGGWRSYAREANAPEPAASAPAGTASERPADPAGDAPAPAAGGGHGGHGKHKQK